MVAGPHLPGHWWSLQSNHHSLFHYRVLGLDKVCNEIIEWSRISNRKISLKISQVISNNITSAPTYCFRMSWKYETCTVYREQRPGSFKAVELVSSSIWRLPNAHKEYSLMLPDQKEMFDNQKDACSNQLVRVNHEIVILRKLMECPSQIEFSAAKAMLVEHLW